MLTLKGEREGPIWIPLSLGYNFVDDPFEVEPQFRQICSPSLKPSFDVNSEETWGPFVSVSKLFCVRGGTTWKVSSFVASSWKPHSHSFSLNREKRVDAAVVFVWLRPLVLELTNELTRHWEAFLYSLSISVTKKCNKSPLKHLPASVSPAYNELNGQKNLQSLHCTEGSNGECPENPHAHIRTLTKFK